MVIKEQLKESRRYRVGAGEKSKVRRMVKKEEFDPLSSVLLKQVVVTVVAARSVPVARESQHCRPSPVVIHASQLVENE